MTVITAYKCPDTGKIFEHKEKYQKHRQKVLSNLQIQREAQAALKLDQSWWEQNFWHAVKSPAQLKAAIMLHRSVLAARGLKNSQHHLPNIGNTVKPTPIVEFLQFEMSWCDSITNTHSCPHNGVRNWRRDSKLPIGYSGWTGSIEYTVQSCPGQEGSYPGSSDMWVGSRIHTGTGGGGSSNNITYTQRFRYSITLWAEDWPAMAAAYHEVESYERVWVRLRDELTWPTSFAQHVILAINQKYPAEEYLQRMGVDTAQ